MDDRCENNLKSSDRENQEVCKEHTVSIINVFNFKKGLLVFCSLVTFKTNIIIMNLENILYH